MKDNSFREKYIGFGLRLEYIDKEGNRQIPDINKDLPTYTTNFLDDVDEMYFRIVGYIDENTFESLYVDHSLSRAQLVKENYEISKGNK